MFNKNTLNTEVVQIILTSIANELLTTSFVTPAKEIVLEMTKIAEAKKVRIEKRDLTKILDIHVIEPLHVSYPSTKYGLIVNESVIDRIEKAGKWKEAKKEKKEMNRQQKVINESKKITSDKENFQLFRIEFENNRWRKLKKPILASVFRVLHPGKPLKGADLNNPSKEPSIEALKDIISSKMLLSSGLIPSQVIPYINSTHSYGAPINTNSISFDDANLIENVTDFLNQPLYVCQKQASLRNTSLPYLNLLLPIPLSLPSDLINSNTSGDPQNYENITQAIFQK